MKQKLKRVRGSGNIFVDLGFDKAEAENLKLRSELMMCIEDYYRQRGMTQAAAAKALGITQPRLNALLKGKIGLFSLDALVTAYRELRLAAAAAEVGESKTSAYLLQLDFRDGRLGGEERLGYYPASGW